MKTSRFELPLPTAASSRKRVLVLGLGNDILSDDAVGLLIVRELRQLLSEADVIEVCETGELGLSLLDYVVGFDELILVDAVQTGHAPPGWLHEFDGSDLKALPTTSPHSLGVGEVLMLGQLLGMSVPQRIRVFAVEVQDPYTLGTHLTPPLQAAFPGLVGQILAAARQPGRTLPCSQ